MTDNVSLAVRQPQLLTSFDDVSRAAQAMAQSGYFSDAKSAAQAIVKILAGQEMGFGPFASMNGIYIIQGRPSIGANLMAAAVKGSGRYNYRVTEMTDKNCSIDFYEGREKIGTSSFTLDDAKKAGTKNLDKFPRNMLFARAMSNGVRWYCPDVFNGSAVYTPEELGAEVNEEGQPVNLITVEPSKPSATAQQTEPVEIIVDTQTEILDVPVRPINSKISYETACAIMSVTAKKPYGELTNEELSNHSTGIAKALAANHLAPERREDLELKRDAIAVILQTRNGAQA